MDVYAKIMNGDYISKIEVPARLKKPDMPFSPTPESARKFADDLEAYENSKGEINRIRQDRANDETRLYNQFVADLEAEYGLVGHPKAKQVLKLAREYASNGDGSLQEIWSYYEDLASLVK